MCREINVFFFFFFLEPDFLFARKTNITGGEISDKLIYWLCKARVFLFLGLRYTNWIFSDRQSPEKTKKRTCALFIIINFHVAESCFKIIFFSVISNNPKNKQCQAKSVFFNLNFFRSAGNIIQQIKKVLPCINWKFFRSAIAKKKKIYMATFILFHVVNQCLEIINFLLTFDIVIVTAWKLRCNALWIISKANK